MHLSESFVCQYIVICIILFIFLPALGWLNIYCVDWASTTDCNPMVGSVAVCTGRASGWTNALVSFVLCILARSLGICLSDLLMSVSGLLTDLGAVAWVVAYQRVCTTLWASQILWRSERPHRRRFSSVLGTSQTIGQSPEPSQVSGLPLCPTVFPVPVSHDPYYNNINEHVVWVCVLTIHEDDV